MSHFTEHELDYLKSQRLGRLATVSPAGQPQNAPVGFRYNPELDTIDIGGRFMSRSKKYRNVLKQNLVAFVVDDVLPPWKPRGVEVRGIAEAVPTGGEKIWPTQIIGWGIESVAGQPMNRKVKSSP